MALAFPDLYDLGMSYLGLRILLHRAQQVEGVSCERVFMPWFDAVSRMRKIGLPLFTLETHTPLSELDLLGINLQYELHCTNILGLLELGGIPLRSEQRCESDPIILGGGPLSLHPEPYAPFFDAIAIGDGESTLPEILETLKALKSRGASRRDKVRALGDISGVYLPGYYRPRYSEDGRYLGLERLDASLPETVPMRITPQLLPEFYPSKPLVSTVEATHNRLVVEIARGCSRGCRFCGSGMINRPVRERSPADIVDEIGTGLEATGYSEVSLLSLSAADYSCLEELLVALDPVLKGRQVSLSFPSLRPDRFTPAIADRAAAGSRTGLTLAPEAATPRLRAVINKEVADEDLLQAVQTAFERQWKSVKLYFMIGLPTETDEDVWALVDLVKKVVDSSRRFGGRNLNVSISPFTPKPHTPFERQGQASMEDLNRRVGILKRGLGRVHSVRLEIRNLDVSSIEAAIARGDRRTAEAIEASYRAGGLFDAWTDGFSARRWKESFAQSGLETSQGSRLIPDVEILPWSHIQAGVSDEFLGEEMTAARQGHYTADCRQDRCQLCGLQERPDLPCPETPRYSKIFGHPQIQSHPSESWDPESPERLKQPWIPVSAGMSTSEIAVESQQFHRYRLIYSRTSPAQFVAHLDVLGVMERALRRLGVRLEFTAGMRPHLRLVASPPLAVGMTSSAEYLDFGLVEVWDVGKLNCLQGALPPGFTVLEVIVLPQGNLSLGALDTFLYCATPNEESPPLKRGDEGDQKEGRWDLCAAISKFLDSPEIPMTRTTPGKVVPFDARPAIWKLEQKEDGALLVGLKSSGGPMPKVSDILGTLTGAAPEALLARWHTERIGQWWNVDEQLYSPTDNYIRSGAEHNSPAPLDGEKRIEEDKLPLPTSGEIL